MMTTVLNRPSGGLSRLSRNFATAGSLLGGFVAMAVASAAMDVPLKVQGSTTFNSEILSIHRPAIEKVVGRTLSIVANKSSWGLLALVEKRVDVAMISAPLDAEVQAARKLGPEFSYDDLRAHPIGMTRVAFISHPSNPVQSLPLETVIQILKGEITNWSAVNGPDLPILVVAVKEGGGTVVSLRANALGDAPLAAGAIRLESAHHVLKAVSQEPRAIGIAQLRVAREAKAREIETGRHVEQVLSFVTRGEPSPEVAALIHATRAIASDAKN